MNKLGDMLHADMHKLGKRRITGPFHQAHAARIKRLNHLLDGALCAVLTRVEMLTSPVLRVTVIPKSNQ
jgi:hypothetical protein